MTKEYKMEFRVDGVDYMATDKNYFYKVEAGKKIRIKQAEFDKAFDDYCDRSNEQLDDAIAEAEMDDWAKEVQEMEAAKEAHKKEQEASDRQAEDAINGKSKPKKKRKSKDIAHESHGITLTAKQVLFMQMMPGDDFWEHELDSVLWIDVFTDTVANIFSPMAVGAMVSTLREKGIIVVGVEKMNGKKCKFMKLTALGKDVAKEMGLN